MQVHFDEVILSGCKHEVDASWQESDSWKCIYIWYFCAISSMDRMRVFETHDSGSQGINTSMNYCKHYELLISRANGRALEMPFERHHIIPRCLGGKDNEANIATLTPEEHYVAHQLLVKMYPAEVKLVYAANMMCVNRRSNKLYGWLKRRYHAVCKQRVGAKNSSYGTRWVTNGITPVKIKKTDKLPIGFSEGRTIKMMRCCAVCGNTTNSRLARFCDIHRKKGHHVNGYRHSDQTKAIMKQNRASCGVGEKNSQHGTHWITNDSETKKIKISDPIPTGWKKGRTKQ